jgi:hypothetical protein
VVNVAGAHVDVMKWANVVVDGPCEAAHGSECDEEAAGGEQEVAAGPVGNVFAQEIAERGLV